MSCSDRNKRWALFLQAIILFSVPQWSMVLADFLAATHQIMDARKRILRNPLPRDVIPGTGGVRKGRAGARAKGGGARAV